MLKQWSEIFSEMVTTDYSKTDKLHRAFLLHMNVASN
jgi:hypothetical protein